MLKPLVSRIRDHVFAADRLHADDTPIRVLDPKVAMASDGAKRAVKTGRIWVYVRDDTPFAGDDPPAAVYLFSPDRKGEHPQSHLAGSAGILQADAYSGFGALYKPDPMTGAQRIQEASCWAHLRRDFHDEWTSSKSPIALEAINRIGVLYDIERRIAGCSAQERLVVRRAESKPVAEAFKCFAQDQLNPISGKSDLAKAFRYGLTRWASFTLFLEDGRVAIDNNPAKRAIRPIALGRKNFLFAGSDAGEETLAEAMTIIETTKLNGLNPQAYLADILGRINDHKINALDELLLWNWQPAQTPSMVAAA